MNDFFVQSIKIALHLERAEKLPIFRLSISAIVPYLGVGWGWGGGANPGILGTRGL